jgi:hypothetical protein
MDGAAREALTIAVRQSLSAELDELGRLDGSVEDLFESLDDLSRRVGAIERRISPRPSIAQEAEIRRLFGLGISSRAVAEIVGVSRDTVLRRVRDAAPPPYSYGLDGKRRRRSRARMNGASDSMP